MRLQTLAPSQRGNVIIERKVWAFAPGIVGLRQRFSGDGLRIVVTHAASLLAVVEVEAGSLYFPLAHGEVKAPPRFVLSVPPRSVLPMRFEAARVQSDGLGRVGAFVEGGPTLRAEAGFELEAMRGARVLQPLDADAAVPASVVRARLALHEQLAELAPVRVAAAAAGMTAETLTRAFDKAYGLTPKQYCTRARLFDAAIGLFCGVPVLTAALTSGFNDLSRFYAQFKRLLGSTPGAYARAGNRQDRAER